MRESQHAIERLIEREVARGVAVDRIVLAGFSQGGAIALQTGLRYRSPAGGRRGSVELPAGAGQAGKRASARPTADVPIFMAHGVEDPIVPLKLAAASCSRLLTMGYPVEWHEYHMPHTVCAEEVRDLGSGCSECWRSCTP